MYNPNPTFYIRDAARNARQVEVPAAQWGDGMNNAGSCAPGIGINIDGGPVSGQAQQFTLLDQDEDPRAPQVSQHISGSGHVPNGQYPLSGGNEGKGTVAIRADDVAGHDNTGSVAPTGEAYLEDLDIGWTAGTSAAPPSNTALPTLSGTPTVGDPLTVSDGTWDGTAPITYEYEFFVDGNSVQGPGANNEYTPDPADDGLDLYATVTATNSEGSDTADTATDTVVT